MFDNSSRFLTALRQERGFLPPFLAGRWRALALPRPDAGPERPGTLRSAVAAGGFIWYVRLDSLLIGPLLFLTQINKLLPRLSHLHGRNKSNRSFSAVSGTGAALEHSDSTTS